MVKEQHVVRRHMRKVRQGSTRKDVLLKSVTEIGLLDLYSIHRNSTWVSYTSPKMSSKSGIVVILV